MQTGKASWGVIMISSRTSIRRSVRKGTVSISAASVGKRTKPMSFDRSLSACSWWEVDMFLTERVTAGYRRRKRRMTSGKPLARKATPSRSVGHLPRPASQGA